MNIEVLHPNLLLSRGMPSAWRYTGAAIVLGGGATEVKAWPAADWRQLVYMWSQGKTSAQINQHFQTLGYDGDQVRMMRALMIGNDQILPPIDRALFVLAGYAKRDERAAGGFTLFDRAVRSIDIIRAANRVLCSLALPEIRYPNAEGVEA